MSNTFTRDPRPRIQYSADGVRTAFAFPFEVLSSDDLLVYAGTELATGFAIGGLGQPGGGEIVFSEPPAAGTTLPLVRRTEGIRESEFVDGGPFRASAINAELDRVMLLIQEDREEHGRSLRGHPREGDLDFCLPATSERANKLLGFDSAGAPIVFGPTELPDSGDASGLVVTPSGGTTARALGEHLATPVNVRDFGALGDGATDDAAAFLAAITAAQTRSSSVYVPASPTSYLLGSSLDLDGVALYGDGPGSMLELAIASGFALQLTGSGARISNLRLLGPGASAWPASAAAVDLSGVALEGVRIAAGAEGAALHGVEIAGCETAVAVEGNVRGIVDCAFRFNRIGVDVRAGAQGALFMGRSRLHGCTAGVRATAGATLAELSVQGGTASACGLAFDLTGPTSGWRGIEISGLDFADNLEADLEAGRRQAVGVRGCHIDGAGKRAGTAIALLAQGETVAAPNLIVENTRADVTEVASVQLSGGTNLDLLAPGDLIVLASDADDLDDLWTALKATRGGVVHKVNAQTLSTATIELATAAGLPLVMATDVVRVVGRFGTAVVDSVGALANAADFTWLRADDHCRVLAAHNPMPASQIETLGPDTDLRHIPGRGGEAITLSGVELQQGAINGALARLVTLEIAQDSAESFVPDSTIGMVQAFSHGATGDPAACLFSYRADAFAHITRIAGVSTAQVLPPTALTGTSGDPNEFTFSAHTDGRIYVENRLVGAPRKVSLFLTGVPL